MILLTDNDLESFVKDDYRHTDGWKPKVKDYFAKIQQTTGLLSWKLLIEDKARRQELEVANANFLRYI